MAEMTDYLETALLDHVLRATPMTAPAGVYLALYTAAPGETGGGTEVTGGSYARQAVTFTAPVGGITYNSGSVTFTSMPAATVVAVGLTDAATAGNLLYYKAITSVAVNAGDNFTLNDGDMSVEHQ